MSTISACVPAGADFGSRTPDRTCQPSDASVRATSRPIPRLAPVISAVSFIYDSDLHDAPSPACGGGQGWGEERAMSIELAFSSTHCTSLSIVPCGPTLTLPRVAGEG